MRDRYPTRLDALFTTSLSSQLRAASARPVDLEVIAVVRKDDREAQAYLINTPFQRTLQHLS